MKALIKRDALSSYELVDLPIPKPKEDEILIKVEKVSICGSDIPLYKWDETGKKIAKLPFTPGHEMFGTVRLLSIRIIFWFYFITQNFVVPIRLRSISLIKYE